MKEFNFAQRCLYWLTYGICTVAMFIFYFLKGVEEIARHYIIRYIRLWKQEIDQ